MESTRADEGRRIVIVCAAHAEILDIAGPWEVFAKANHFCRGREQEPYAIDLVSATDDLSIQTSSGLNLTATTTFRKVAVPIDTMLIAGGTPEGVAIVSADPVFLRWLQAVSGSVRRLGSICTGAFILAAAGLLEGRRATTHWSMCDELKQRYPRASVGRDSIFIFDRGVYTSAGGTAGMDLALVLVEEDFGVEMAARIARDLALYLRRPSGQPRLSATLAVQIADRHSIRELQSWILGHLSGDLSLPALARRVTMSKRNFSRVFSAETGLTPARFVERLRVETAQKRLEKSDEPVKQIAAECGFGSTDSMRRAFQRHSVKTPTGFRARREPSDRCS